MRAVNGCGPQSGDDAALAVGPPCPARSGSDNHDSLYADNEPELIVQKMMSTKTYVVGKVHRREAPRGGSDGSGEPPVAACLSRRRSRVPRRYQTIKCGVRRAQKRLEHYSSHRTVLWLECRY